jgi:hypothetical protein
LFALKKGGDFQGPAVNLPDDNHDQPFLTIIIHFQQSLTLFKHYQPSLINRCNHLLTMILDVG